MIFRRKFSLPVVLAGTFGVGLLASVFLNISQHKNAEDDRKLMQGQITDLTYQVKQDQAGASSPSPSPQPTSEAVATPEPSTSPVPSPAASTAVLGAEAAAKTATVKRSANLHLTPATTSKIVLSYTKLPVGTVVTLGATSGTMQQVTVKGVTGYILASYLQ